MPAEISAEGWISVTGCRVKTPLEDVARHEVRVRNDAVAYDDGAEFVTVTREWAGTTVDDALAELARAQSQAVRLHQEIRLRLLLA